MWELVFLCMFIFDLMGNVCYFVGSTAGELTQQMSNFQLSGDLYVLC